MTVAEAIMIQKDFISRKYNILRYNNKVLKESMKTLTNAYSNMWEWLNENKPEVLDEYLMEGIKDGNDSSSCNKNT